MPLNIDPAANRISVRDRPEINATLLEEKNRSDLEDFPLQVFKAIPAAEKSSRSERFFSSRSVAFISGRSLNANITANSGKKRVQLIAPQNKMFNLLHGPERLAIIIADVSRFFFLSLCWGIFVFYALQAAAPAAGFPFFARMVVNMHMIIQGI